MGAANLTLDRPSHEKLLIQIRRATGADQLKVLEWLMRKFPKQAEADDPALKATGKPTVSAEGSRERR
jgi:hypothetical protein